MFPVINLGNISTDPEGYLLTQVTVQTKGTYNVQNSPAEEIYDFTNSM